MRLALAALLAGQSAPPPVVSTVIPNTEAMADAQACERLRATAREVTAELPMMIDTVTRLDGMSVICSLRAVTWNKFIRADMSEMREGWQNRKQAQFNGIICGNASFVPLARRGWRFTQNLTFQSGERIIMDADCPAD